MHPITNDPASKPVRAALYARVSTDTQTTDNQLLELRDYAERKAWTPTEYIDEAVSGTKASRPALNRMMADAKAGRLDLVVVWRADRLGRSLVNALLTIADLDAHDVQIVSLREGFDTKTPSGRLQLQLILCFAEYELESIRERIKAGLSRARSQGQRLGRKPAIHPKSAGYDLIADFTLSGAAVARRLGVAKETVNRIRREIRKAGDQQSPATQEPPTVARPHVS